LPIGGCKEIAAADTVDENPDIDAATMGLVEGSDESAADGVAAEKIAAERDTDLSRPDGREHLGIGLVAIVQQGDGIAGLGRTSCNPPARPLQRNQMVDAIRLAGQSRDPRARVFNAANLDGPTTHAVYAEEEIEEAADDRGEPGKTDPGDGRPGVASIE
jgi:hypothetical protein